MSKPDPIEAKLLKKDRRKSREFSASMIMLLIVASAVIGFLPIRTTLAAGSAYLDNLLGPGGTVKLLGLAGTHITVNAGGSFMNTTTLSRILAAANVSSSLLSYLFTHLDYMALKAGQINFDVTSSNQTDGFLIAPIGFPNANGTIVHVRLTLLSVVLAGYNLSGSVVVDRYNETQLAALNPALLIPVDRVFIDLFVDPVVNQANYIIAADMTIYQSLSVLVQASLL